MPNTQSLPHPVEGIAPLRVNVLVALFDLKTGHVFVGDLISKPNDMRAYTASMVEGGVDQGERLETALGREPAEETGYTDTVFLGAVKEPVICAFEDWETAKKYSGKIFQICAYGVADITAMNLDAQTDNEGPTFSRGHFMPLGEAEKYLDNKTTSPMRKQFIRETILLLQPVAEALATLRSVKMFDVNSSSVHTVMPTESAALFSSHVPQEFPTPSALWLARPTARRAASSAIGEIPVGTFNAG